MTEISVRPASPAADDAEVAAIAAGASRHIPSLDGLRAVSFLLVFLAHAGLAGVVPGGFGVTVFFFLSGFLITTLMRAEYDRQNAVNFKHFWLRRGLRILPPFYLVLAAAIISASIYAPGSMTLGAICAQAFHYTNYWIIYHGEAGLPANGGTGVYWSLAVEEHFYLLFPWLYVWMRKAEFTGRQQALILLGGCGAVLAWRFVLVLLFHVSTDRTYMASDTRIDSILFGCALAVCYNPTMDRWIADERRWKYFYAPLAVSLLLASFLYRGDVFRQTARYSLQGLALAPIFIAAIRYPRWLPFRVLNLKPMMFIGLLSYSLYLLHYGALIYVQTHLASLSAVAQGLVALILSVGLAWVIYLLVEKPCARLRRRLTD